MDKITIKPTAQEILIKGSGSEGHVDIYSYDFEQNDDKKGLGHLFMVGNIQDQDGDESDVQYITNLIASLAKREYYAQGDIAPKLAFTNALKKVNDVIDEFFKNKNLQINAGLFAIADESIYISRLGKFKIYLARDGKNIDVLNNIEHFSKEHFEERKFSNIISGKVHAGDRVLAFYPNKAVTSRERFIKADFIKFDKTSFIDKINAFKETKKDFACGALYIDVNQHRESTVRKTRLKSETIKLNPEHGTPILTAEPKTKATINPITLAAESREKQINPAITSETAELNIDVDNNNAKQEIPKIIAAEFLFGRKGSPLQSLLKNIHISDFNPKKRLIIGLAGIVGIAILIGLGFTAKSVLTTSQSDRQLNDKLKEITKNIGTAEDKINTSDFIDARNILASSYSSLIGSGYYESPKVKDTLTEISKLLDSMDNASEASVSLFAQISENNGLVRLISNPGDEIQAVLTSKDKNFIASVNANGDASDIVQITDITPNSLLSLLGFSYNVISDATGLKMQVITDTKTRSIDLPADKSMRDGALYEDNLYYLSSDKIFKIVDIAKNGKEPKLWSQESISINNELIAVDGNIYTLGSDGIYSFYFMGKKKFDKNIQISAQKGDILLSTKDGKYVHLIKTETGRIYDIEKATGNLVKTIKIGTVAKILDATISSSEIIYIATSDNKIWKVAY